MCQFRTTADIFQVTGDGALVEFGSAVNGVQCAIELLKALAAANGELPEARRIVVRVGVNLGDIMVDGGDLYGDEVNIATRLEGIAEPGGVLVSGKAFADGAVYGANLRAIREVDNAQNVRGPFREPGPSRFRQQAGLGQIAHRPLEYAPHYQINGRHNLLPCCHAQQNATRLKSELSRVRLAADISAVVLG